MGASKLSLSVKAIIERFESDRRPPTFSVQVDMTPILERGIEKLGRWVFEVGESEGCRRIRAFFTDSHPPTHPHLVPPSPILLQVPAGGGSGCRCSSL